MVSEQVMASPLEKTTNPEQQEKTLETQVREQVEKSDRMEKDITWLKEAVKTILDQLGYITPMGPRPQFADNLGQTSQGFVTPTDRARGDGILPLPVIMDKGKAPEVAGPMVHLEPRTEKSTPFLQDVMRNTGDSSFKKMELPCYEGQNPDDWIFRVEKCFSVNQTHKDDKLDEALACLAGCAVTWWRNIQSREVIKDWFDFKERLRKRFKPSRGGSAVDQLMVITQTGTVEEYRERFEELSVEVPHIPDDVLESMFLRGLKRSIREQVVRYRPIGMDDIVDTAKLIEAQEQDQSGYQNRIVPRTNVEMSSSLYSGGASYQPPRSSEPVAGLRVQEPNREEKKTFVGTDNRRINPCRYCGERFFMGHKCKNQRFTCMEVEDDAEKVCEREGEFENNKELFEKGEEQDLVHLSLHSMTGLSAEKSMRMKGKIAETDVIVLIDSGATSNFISEVLARKISLPTTETRDFGVRVGNGRVITGKGKCSGVLLTIQGLEIMDEFLLFELGNIDIVLGYSWLAKLGDTRINWGHHTISFKVNNHWVSLVGDPTLGRAHVSLNSMETVRNEGEVVCLMELSTLFTEIAEQHKTPVKPSILKFHVSSTLQDHLEHEGRLVLALQQHRFYVNDKNFEFKQREVAYLGHIISEKEVAADASKIVAVKEWLPWTMFCCNTSHYSSLTTTPFKVLYPRDLPTLLCYGDVQTVNAIAEERLKQRDDMLVEIKSNLAKAQTEMRNSANKYMLKVNYDVGESATKLIEEYSHFHLEDKVSLLRGSIDKIVVPLTDVKRRQSIIDMRSHIEEKKKETHVDDSSAKRGSKEAAV